MAPKILVVDDHPPTIKLIQVALEEQGCEVVTAGNGAEGLLAANSQSPDLVILDVMMPVMDGFEMLRLLRASPPTQEVPVVMLTARAEDEAILRGWATGISSYLTKPFSIGELVVVVRRILAGQQEEARQAAEGAAGASNRE